MSRKKTRRQSPANLGLRSLRKLPIRLRGTPCSFARHFDGGTAIHEVLSFLERIAKIDPESERFAFPTISAIREDANRYKPPEKQFTMKSIQRAVHLAEDRHWIKPHQAKRWGKERKGWMVREHPPVEGTECDLDVFTLPPMEPELELFPPEAEAAASLEAPWTAVQAGNCQANAEQLLETPTSKAQVVENEESKTFVQDACGPMSLNPAPMSLSEAPMSLADAPMSLNPAPMSLNSTPMSLNSVADVPPDVALDVPAKSGQSADKTADPSSAASNVASTLASDSALLTPLSHAFSHTPLSHAVESTPLEAMPAPREGAPPSTSTSKSKASDRPTGVDTDRPARVGGNGRSLTQNPSRKGCGLTIGDRFRSLNGDFHETVDLLSAGTFDSSYVYKRDLENDWLLDSIHAGVRQVGGAPFLGYESHAKAMGAAMEIAKKKHSRNMPRGWVPVMRALRDPERTGLPNYLFGNDMMQFPDDAAEKLVADLRQFISTDPKLQAVMLGIIIEHGFPHGWKGALAYVERTLAAWDGSRTELERVHDLLRDRLK